MLWTACTVVFLYSFTFSCLLHSLLFIFLKHVLSDSQMHKLLSILCNYAKTLCCLLKVNTFCCLFQWNLSGVSINKTISVCCLFQSNPFFCLIHKCRTCWWSYIWMSLQKNIKAVYFAPRFFCIFHIQLFLFYRDTFRLLLCKYQAWFEEAMIYWLQTFRSECVCRMEKALEIDQDVSSFPMMASSNTRWHLRVTILSSNC